MKDGLNKHAVVAWLYIWETVRRCGNKTVTDFAFMQFVLDMSRAYPYECDALRVVSNAIKEVNHDFY